MTVGIYYHSHLKVDFGGVARVSCWLAERLTADGHEVVAFVPRDREPLSVPGIPTKKLSRPYGKQNPCELARLVEENKVDVLINQSSFYSGAKCLRKVKCPIITVVHYNPAPIATEREKRKIVGNWRGKLWAILYNFFPHLEACLSRWRSRSINRAIWAFSDFVCVLSDSYVAYYEHESRRYGVPLIAIGNPIPFHEAPAPTKGENVVIFVGRLTHVEKRLDLMLSIWRRAVGEGRKWKLIIVGSGPDRETLEDTAHRENLNVEFVGRKDPRQYYGMASLLMLTSATEGFPLVLPEAMSYGVVPIIFDSFGAAHDIVEDGKTGFLIPPYDIDSFADKLCKVMAMDLTPMRGAVIRKANEFSGDVIYAKWKKLIRETCCVVKGCAADEI